MRSINSCKNIYLSRKNLTMNIFIYYKGEYKRNLMRLCLEEVLLRSTMWPTSKSSRKLLTERKKLNQNTLLFLLTCKSNANSIYEICDTHKIICVRNIKKKKTQMSHHQITCTTPPSAWSFPFLQSGFLLGSSFMVLKALLSEKEKRTIHNVPISKIIRLLRAIEVTSLEVLFCNRGEIETQIIL